MERGALLRAAGGVFLIGAASLLVLAAVAPGAVSRVAPLATEAQAALARTGAQPHLAPQHEDIAPIRHLVIPTGRDQVTVPILMYHYIQYFNDDSNPLGVDLSVSPDNFRAQMDYLAANGYHPIDFNDLRAYLHGSRVLPSKPVILSFDDGYADFYTAAYPVLAQHGFKAVSYVVPGFFGRGGYMTAGQVLELDRDGVEIASHTWSHFDLTTLGHDQLTWEVQAPKTYLEQLLGHPVVDFCYPSGRFNDAVVAAVGAAGYQTATTTQLGYTHSLGDALTWARVRVHGREPLDVFARMLGPSDPAVETWVDPYPAPVLPLLPEVFPIVYPGAEPRLAPGPQPAH